MNDVTPRRPSEDVVVRSADDGCGDWADGQDEGWTTRRWKFDQPDAPRPGVPLVCTYIVQSIGPHNTALICGRE